MIIAELPAYADEIEFEIFESNISDYFRNYLGKEVFVIGKNLGYENLTGEKNFTLEKTDQIWREITPDTDISFKIENTNDDHVFKARCSHHDSPTGEHFALYIIEQHEDEII